MCSNCENAEFTCVCGALVSDETAGLGLAEHEPGTRFVVVEIPPGASDREADEITEKVSAAAHEIDGQYDGSWDLFIYRQHNAPPANVPALPGTGVTEQAVERCGSSLTLDKAETHTCSLEVGHETHSDGAVWWTGPGNGSKPYMGVQSPSVDSTRAAGRPVVDREAVKRALATELCRQGADDWFRVDGLARDLTASVMDLLTGDEQS